MSCGLLVLRSAGPAVYWSCGLCYYDRMTARLQDCMTFLARYLLDNEI
jgi:hypothetical protein